MDGADADDLDRVANAMITNAGRMAGTSQRIGRTIHSAPWHGRSADRFRQQWNSQHSRALIDASGFLTKGAGTLRRNAQEQRNASEGTSGALRSIDASPAAVAQGMDDVRAALLALGLGVDEVQKLLDLIGPYAKVLKIINLVLKDPALKEVLGALGHVADGVGLLGNFLTDLGEHAELPFDEAVVHAVAETGARFAVGAGTEAAAQWATTAILGAVTGGVGAVPGYFVGAAVGFVVGKIVDAGVDAAKEHGVDIYEGSGDVAVTAFRDLKAHDNDLGATAMDAAGVAGRAVLKGTENLLADGASSAKHMLSSINPLD